MHMGNGQSRGLHGALGSRQKGRADAPAFFRCFDIQSVQKGLGGVGDSGIADAADHPVMLIHGDPEEITLIKIALMNMKKVFIEPGDPPRASLACRTMKIRSSRYRSSYGLITMAPHLRILSFLIIRYENSIVN